MNVKRSDAMRRILELHLDGAHNSEGVIEKLDGLDDQAFWAWWQESEKERHMLAAGWMVHDGKWTAADQSRPHMNHRNLTKDRAWEIFRVEQGGATALPMMPIMLAFDPAKIDGLCEIFQNPTAWTLWLLWKARHIVSQHFNNSVKTVAKLIDEKKPKTPVDLMACFPGFRAVGDFLSTDIEKFCQEAVPFFTGEREVEFVINPPNP